MRKFLNNKLWRDKAIENMEQTGGKIHWKELNDEEFLVALRNKLLEEAQEVCQAKTKEELIEELADVLEVIASLGDMHQFTFQDVIDAQNKKHQKRGGFAGRKFVTISEFPENSFGEKYCLADPEKYPEIID